MSSTPESPFREAIALVPRGDGWSARLSDEWTQGRAVYGGLVAAAALSAMRSQVESDRAPRGLAVSFVGPVEPGEVTISVELLRAGRSASQVEAKIWQHDRCQLVALGTFGGPRVSPVRVEPPPPPEIPALDSLTDLPYLEGVTPVFTQRFVYRFGLGQFPFSGADQAHLGGWTRFREAAGVADEEVLLGLLDAWPDPTLSLLSGPAPASSMSWSVSFLADARRSRADDWWLYEARTYAAADGYAHTRAMLWDAAGRAVAADNQVVAVFTPPAPKSSPHPRP